MRRNAALKVFLISDTISVCWYIAILYIYSFATINDQLPLQEYASLARTLMQTAFLGMMVAFAAGTYAVVTPNCMWLGILICFLCGSLLILTFLSDNFSHNTRKAIHLLNERMRSTTESIFFVFNKSTQRSSACRP